jgi:hypothetical protein
MPVLWMLQGEFAPGVKELVRAALHGELPYRGDAH